VQAEVDSAIALFADCRCKQAGNFCTYLTKHRSRIVNYSYYQDEQLCSIGLAQLSLLSSRLTTFEISGAQWKPENVNQILQLRCAYLKGLLAI